MENKNKKIKVVLLHAKAQHGKDEFFLGMKKHIKNIYELHFADRLKSDIKDEEYVLNKLDELRKREVRYPRMDEFIRHVEDYKREKGQLAWDGEKDSLGRRYMQLIGDVEKGYRLNYDAKTYDELIASHDDLYYYANIVEEEIQKAIAEGRANHDTVFVIPDLRFPFEVDPFKNKEDIYDVTTIKIVRPNFDNGLGENGKHISETAMDDYIFDHLVENKFDVKKLHFMAEIFVKIVLLGKKTIIFDFDDTLGKSKKAFCDAYNILFHTHPKFKPADYTKSKEWNFVDECPLLGELAKKEMNLKDEDITPKIAAYLKARDVAKIFRSTEFWEHLELFPDTLQTLWKILDKGYRIMLCTLGTIGNIEKKMRYLFDSLWFSFDGVITISMNEVVMDKSMIKMDGCIFIDDSIRCYETSDAPVRFLIDYYHHREEYKEKVNYINAISEVLDVLI